MQNKHMTNISTQNGSIWHLKYLTVLVISGGAGMNYSFLEYNAVQYIFTTQIRSSLFLQMV